jgi:hypothetical protein
LGLARALLLGLAASSRYITHEFNAMPAEQNTAELTIRDVLLQVDRRLTLIEEDQRSLDEKVERLDTRLDVKIDGAHDKLDTQAKSFYAKLDAKIDALGARLDAKIDAKFHLMIGLLLTSWLSMMAAILLK